MRNSEKSEILCDAQNEGNGGEYKPLTETERLRCVIKILEKDVKEAREDGVKAFAHFLIDKAKDGVITISDLPDLVCEFRERNE